MTAQEKRVKIPLVEINERKKFINQSKEKKREGNEEDEICASSNDRLSTERVSSYPESTNFGLNLPKLSNHNLSQSRMSHETSAKFQSTFNVYQQKL